MSVEPFAELEGIVAELRDMVGSIETTALLVRATSERVHGRDNLMRQYGLFAPIKQLNYLIGLLLTTPNPSEPSMLDDRTWTKCCGLLEKAFQCYHEQFANCAGSYSRTDMGATRVAAVANVYYHHFFSTVIHATHDQFCKRLEELFCPFDAVLDRDLGLSCTAGLNIVKFIESESYFAVAHVPQSEWLNELPSATRICRSDVAREFGDGVANAFWEAFTVERADDESFLPTQTNPFERKPFVRTGPDTAMWTWLTGLFHAYIARFTEVLRAGEASDEFLRSRDKSLERRAYYLFESFFGDRARLYPNVYESADGHFEHDLVIHWKKTVFVIESKASPIREPFRDPDKAYARLKSDFSPIQKGYEQAQRIAALADCGQDLRLYDERGRWVATIPNSDAQEVFRIVCTHENYGPLGVDLAPMLKKDDNQPYPWVVGEVELENILAGFKKRGLGPGRFCEFLRGRMQLHGRIESHDEDDVAAVFFSGQSNWARLVAATTGYRIPIDSWERVERAFHEKVQIVLPEPCLMDQIPVISKKQGRNDRCGCGSGRKHKLCCGP